MICSVGELLIDFMQNGENEFSFPVLSAAPGGAPANFICAAKKEGSDAAFIGKVGADAFGKALKATLFKKGIDVSGVIEDSRVFTTLAFVTLDENGERSFSFGRKPGADTCLSFGEIDLSIIDKCDIFHFGSLSFTDEPSRSAVFEALSYAKEKGKIISYDPNYRSSLWHCPETAKKYLLKGFCFADIVKLSGEEAEFLFSAAPERASDILINEYGCSLVFVTLGKNGCYYKNPECSGYTKSEDEVIPVDTTGAGDIFGGTACSLIEKTGKHPKELTKTELHKIATKACSVASLSTLTHGGMI